MLLWPLIATAQERSISFTGINGELLSNVRAHVGLVQRIREDGDAIGVGEWERLRRAVRSEIKQALQPFGYYQAVIQSNHAGQQLRYDIDPGEPVRIRKLNIIIVEPAASQGTDGVLKPNRLGERFTQLEAYSEWRANLSLAEGAVLRQMDYEAAKKKLLAMTVRYGFFAAQLERHEILISEDKLSADVTLMLNAGSRYRFGETTISWRGDPMRIRQRVLDPHIRYQPGDLYDADLLASTQSGLQSTPYFANVEVRPELDVGDDLRVPIEIIFSSVKRHAYNFAIGAGTDTGLRGSVGYENRRLNSRGHHLNLRFGSSEIRQTAILNYRIPLYSAASDSVNLFTSLEEEDNDFRTFEVSKVGAELARRWRNATLSFGLTASRETFLVGDLEQTTDLVVPSIGWKKIASDDPYFPTRGWSADLKLRGASSTLGSDVSLIQLVADGKAVMPLGKGRLLTRVRAAGTQIDEALELPASLGFLTGGDRSVRGYRYESIGVPLSAVDGRGVVATSRDEDLTVGRHLLAASIEYEHPIKEQFALAAFADAGDAFNRDLDLKRGVGLGLRWRLPFGALKLDLASALDRDGKPLRMHLSFGSDL